MIRGEVRSDEARVRLSVKGRRGREQGIEAVIDSGYTGTLTLPPALIAWLGLRWRSVERATLADGSTCVFRVFVGKLAWDGRVRQVLVDEADTDPLIGTRLLRGHEVKVQFRYRGEVPITRLPRQ
jgi:clan AA aspartic protease